jgi:hypothetical protein
MELKERKVTWPELALIAGTRVVLGVGIGLLLTDKLDASQRKALGRALLLIGAFTTIPLAIAVFGKVDSRRPYQAS